jgi:hypothetical protein
MLRKLFGLGLVLVAAFAVIQLVPAFADDKKDDAKWIQLFNGKDLSGWKTHPDDKAKWEVVDGMIVGTGPVGHLYSEKDDYTNFRYRVEAMISDKGNSGQMFRTNFQKGFPKGYEAQINATHGDKIRTGSLYPAFKLTDEDKKKIIVLDMLHKPDEWFVQEVIADGNHIIIKVNGKTTVDFVDPNNSFTKGHFALQQHNDGSVVKFKKVEYMPLGDNKDK